MTQSYAIKKDEFDTKFAVKDVIEEETADEDPIKAKIGIARLSDK